jgi:hypothetical protein
VHLDGSQRFRGSGKYSQAAFRRLRTLGVLKRRQICLPRSTGITARNIGAILDSSTFDTCILVRARLIDTETIPAPSPQGVHNYSSERIPFNVCVYDFIHRWLLFAAEKDAHCGRSKVSKESNSFLYRTTRSFRTNSHLDSPRFVDCRPVIYHFSIPEITIDFRTIMSACLMSTIVVWMFRVLRAQSGTLMPNKTSCILNYYWVMNSCIDIRIRGHSLFSISQACGTCCVLTTSKTDHTK